MMEINTSHLQLFVQSEKARYLLHPTDGEFPRIQNARLGLHLKRNGKKFRLMHDQWAVIETLPIETVETAHGSTTCFTEICQPMSGIRVKLTFALPHAYPFAMLKMELTNQTSDPIQVNGFEMLSTAMKEFTLPNAEKESALSFYSNGWQSWSHSGSYQQEEKQDRSILGGLQQPMVMNPGTPLTHQKAHFSSDFFGVIVDNTSKTGFIAGFLSQKEQFGWLETTLKGSLKTRLFAGADDAVLLPGAAMSTDWAYLGFIDLNTPDPLAVYLEAVARENDIHLDQVTVPAGWCSWYHFYQNITAKTAHQNLQALVAMKEKLPLSLFQLDDGFEREVGDWFMFHERFPEGVAELAEAVKKEGMLPGIWLAPFIVHPKSELYKNHPDWLLRKPSGKRVNAGYVWNSLATALDITIPEALDYACRVIKTAVKDWGYPYLKLDFLYAAALRGTYKDVTKTRAQVMRMGLEAIREAAGDDTILLGCGCPLGSALGLFDAMRIGADVSGYWNPHFPPFDRLFKHEPHMPSAVNSIQNILSRAFMHGKWWVNDPDCLLIRPDTTLTLPEVQALASVIALTGGSLLLSDDMPNVPDDRLYIAQVLLPLISTRPQVLDLFEQHMPENIRLDMQGACGDWHLLGYFNWADKAIDQRLDVAQWGLPEGSYLVHEFWQQKTMLLTHDAPLLLEGVPPHAVNVLALRRFDPQQPCYLGSDLHISQGMEIASWVATPQQISIGLSLPRKATGSIKLYLPQPPVQITVNGSIVEAIPAGDHVHQIPVDVDFNAQVTIKF